MKKIPQSNTRCRGVAVIYREALSVTAMKHHNYISMEYINCLPGNQSWLKFLQFLTVYKPPPKPKPPNKPVFFDVLLLTSGKLLLIQDLNCHFDNPTSEQSKPMLDLLSGPNYQQHVAPPTHDKDHISFPLAPGHGLF